MNKTSRKCLKAIWGLCFMFFFGWAVPREKKWLLDVFLGAGINTILLQAGTILNHWTFRFFWNHGMGNQLDGMGNQLDENDFFGVPVWAFCSLSLLGGWSCLVQLVLEQGKVFALYACGVVLLQRHFCWPHRYCWYDHDIGDIVFAVQSPEVEVCIPLFFESWHRSTAQKWHVSLPTFRKVLSFFPSIRKVDYVKGWSNGKSPLSPLKPPYLVSTF